MRDESGPTKVALWISSIGLLSVLLLGWLSNKLPFLEHGNEATRVGAVAFMVVFMSPFVLIFATAHFGDLRQRRSIWLGCTGGVLLEAVVTIFSFGVLFLLLSAALAFVWWTSGSAVPTSAFMVSKLVSFWIVLSFGASLVLLGSRETPMCWNGTSWSSAESATVSNCTSDIVDTLEGGLAVGALIIGVIGILFAVKSWRRRPFEDAPGRHSAARTV